MDGKEFTTVNSKCPKCGNKDTFQVPTSGMDARRKGTPVKEAFPNLELSRQVQLTSHICPTCQQVSGAKEKEG